MQESMQEFHHNRARDLIKNANDEMALHCEVDNPHDASGTEAIIGSIRELTKLRGDVVLVAVGSLAQDGKIIDDVRDYS